MGKNGKFVNPTDKARREARKKELKKNKKQRQIVRTTLLKNKDPYQILDEIEKLDHMEYNIHEPPPFTEKVMATKRKKLNETWYRVLSLYKKEEPQKYFELKRLEQDLETKRQQLVKVFKAVRSTQEVVLDEIPLPLGPVEEQSSFGLHKEYKRPPPGCPAGIPPKISELELEVETLCGSTKTEEDVNKFLQEIEQVEQTVKTPIIQNALITACPLNPAPPVLPLIMRPTITVNSTFNTNKALHIAPSAQLVTPVSAPVQVSRTFSLPKSTNNYQPPIKKAVETVGKATIEAKPQLRNLSVDATRFLPVSLRVKRPEVKPKVTHKLEGISYHEPEIKKLNTNNGNSKDTAYEDFMKELKDFM